MLQHTLQTTTVRVIITYPRFILTLTVLVDACNGSNNYGVGHSCAFAQSQGGKWSSLASIYCTVLTLLIVPISL